MNYPTTICNLIECFKKLPGVGEKTAERLALSTLNLNEEIIELFSTSLKDTKTKIKKCDKCGNLTESDYCNICTDNTRDENIICVVEESKNIVLFEKLGTFHCRYHVLAGLINPLDGINPEDINLSSLIKRIKEDNIKEIILAIKPSVEGETTALYISKLLEKTNVIVSKIAYGVPMGADIDYIDPITLSIALDGRMKIS